MLKRTKWLRARLIPTRDFTMRELASGDRAIRPVTTGGHVRVFEGARGVVAVGEEFAVDFLFEVLGSLGGGGVAGRAFGVLAGGAVGARVA
jgi:hypothetical protein